jgi:regulator of protease activity HflC (stomatin/prohibitin superfamily)
MNSQVPDETTFGGQPIKKWVSWLTLCLLWFLYWGYVWFFERIDYVSAPPAWWEWLIKRYPLFEYVDLAILVPAEFIAWSVIRHFIPVLLGAWLARRALYRFLSTFYSLPEENDGKAFLKRLRRWRKPDKKATVSLDTDEFASKRGENPILRVGGPARAVVKRGNAVVTEINGRLARVLDAGSWLLARFEYPFQIVDIRPQDHQKDEVKMITKDGINIKTSVGVTFHVDPKDQSPSPEVQFPYDRLFARTAAYDQTVSGDGEVKHWKSATVGAAAGALSEIVANSRLDELAHPEHGGLKPFPSINREMRQVTRAKMAKQGVTVTDTRLGRFELPDEVLEKYLAYWRVYTDKKRRLEEVEGQAALLKEAEIARAKASALMFQAILEGLQRAQRIDPDASSKRIVAIRLIETLQAMARRSQDVSPSPDQLMVSLGNLRKQLLEGGKGNEPPDEQPTP